MKWLIITPFWIFFYFILIYYSFNGLFKSEVVYDPTGSQNTVISILGIDDVISTIVISPSNKINSSGDIRAAALKRFLTNINSPLANHVNELIENADIFGIDYALVPAISMQESNACKIIPVDSYNCWGFGIYGTKVTRFSSYNEAIAKVAKTIKETYIKKGLTNPTLLEDKWTPSSRGTWSYAVTYYMSLIHNLENSTLSP